MITRFQRFTSAATLLFALAIFCGCKTTPSVAKSDFSYFKGQDNFSGYAHSTDVAGNAVLLSPPIKSKVPWNELIVSWNADAPAGTEVKIEASAISAAHQTKFYTIAVWSLTNSAVPRTSVRGQKDADGDVDTDTLILNQPADAVQIRVTMGGTNGPLTPFGAIPALKFLGVSFSNTKQPVVVRPSNHAAWGKIIPTPEHSQHGYPNAKGWCSPTSLSMTLSRWAEVLHRPEMDLTVPQVAASVYDKDFAGTGNWPFNTAFAGSFSGMRSYVTRLDDMTEVEEWINAGIPVILSARWDWLRPGRPLDKDGHLIVCIGFTENGDIVINDPAAHLEKGDSIRQIYKRADVIHSWTKSHNAVYLVYPEDAKIPRNSFGHWE